MSTPTLEIRLEEMRIDGRSAIAVMIDGQADPLHLDSVTFAKDRSRKSFAKAVAEKAAARGCAIDSEEILRLLEAHAYKRASTQPPISEVSADDAILVAKDAKSDELLAKMPEDIRAEAEAMLSDPRLLDIVARDAAELGVAGEVFLVAALYVACTSRLLTSPRPLSVIVQGESSSGKSHSIETVVAMFPPESVLTASDLTANALYYLEPGALMHTIVAGGERSRAQEDDVAEKTRALREMISAGRLVKLLPEKVGDTMRTRRVESQGPIAFIESTTLEKVFTEDANRCLLLGTDETPEQTRRVLSKLAAKANGTDAPDTDRVKAVHHAAQRMLRRVKVEIPFADRLMEAIPSQHTAARRAGSAALGVISALALLHQRQRAVGPLKHGDTIQATVDDYRVARLLLERPLDRALGGGLPDHVRRFAGWLVARFGGRIVNRRQVAAETGCPVGARSVADKLRTLADLDLIDTQDESRGPRAATYSVPSKLPEVGSSWLPKPEEMFS